MMGLKILNLSQGTGEWLSHRAECLNASDAPAMKGVSNYKKRSDLVREKATGIQPEHDAGTLARFRAGHDAEASIRTHAESIIGEELYPVTGENVIDGLRLSASSDGVTMDNEVGWEHKIWNEALAESVRRDVVPESHIWQIIHQHAVFGLKRTLFMVSDGTSEKCEHCWVEVSREQINQLLGSWKQFAEDVRNYSPENEAPVEVVAGRAPDLLPALHIEVTGMVTASNLAQFKETAMAVFRGINTNLQTDQDFADAEKAVKFCKDAEERLDAAKSHALSQTASIDELFRTIDGIKDEAKTVRLKLDKLVKAEKENRKIEIITWAQAEYRKHIDALNKRIGGQWMPVVIPAFAESIKGLKSLESMRDKIATAMANAKIEANEVADRIEENIKYLDSLDTSLAPDFAQICTKQTDDFAALINMRKQQRAEAEAKRIEAEREKIRAEEQAKAEAKARAERESEAARIRAEEQAKARAEAESKRIESRAEEQAKAKVAQPVAQEQKRAAVVIEHQDEISAFIKSRDFKDAGYVRSILVEFVKFQAARAVNNQE
jgi:predicted phage-related endonuclease